MVLVDCTCWCGVEKPRSTKLTTHWIDWDNGAQVWIGEVVVVDLDESTISDAEIIVITGQPQEVGSRIDDNFREYF